MSALEFTASWATAPWVEAEPKMAQCLAAARDIWIFAYGSLMWDPGFAYCEARPALLRGYHRRFCVYSRGHRGTPQCPGLVLGLDRGGACKGVAYRVPAVDVAGALDYLWQREMQSRVYRLRELAIEAETGTVKALAFVVERGHEDYSGPLSLAETARLIHQGIGRRGSARQYLENTVRELERLGLIDGPLHRLEREVKKMAAGEARAA
jgi:cation transport protein ChaC